MAKTYRPGKQIDHYEIHLLLGQGAASRVYLARDQQDQREVVLKFPTDDIIGGAAIYARYRREAEIGKLLQHPRVQVHLNQGEARQEEYMVLEYIPSHPLRVVMKKYEPSLLPVDEALRLILLVCDAMAYIHAHGVIHQDIKPENILVLENGDIKLIDFGIAQVEGERSKPWLAFSELVGTPDYMAPERLAGGPGSVRSDIYAVGVVLYELLCGRTPFEEGEGFAFISRHVSDDPPDILRFRPQLPPALATVVMRMVRCDPKKRYASIEELAHDLRHLDEVIPAGYVPAAPKLGGRYRHVIRLVCIVLLIMLLIIAFGVFAQLAHHAVR